VTFSSRQCPERMQKRKTSGETVDNFSEVQKDVVNWISGTRERPRNLGCKRRKASREPVFLYLYLTSLFSQLTYDFRTLQMSYFPRKRGTRTACTCDTLVILYRSRTFNLYRRSDPDFRMFKLTGLSPFMYSPRFNLIIS